MFQGVKLGIISDIHGNLRAMNSILNVFNEYKIEKIFCLGDNIGYYHQSLEILDLIKKNKIFSIMGNHEAYLVGYLSCPAKKWNKIFLEKIKKNISREDLKLISNCPICYETIIHDKKLAFFHGSPWGPLEEYIYPNSDKINKFKDLEWDYIFLGHTHIPMYKKINNINIINPGSCGQSRDHDPRASAVIIDIFKNEMLFIKENYEIQLTIKEAIECGVSDEAIKVLKGDY